MASRTSPTRVRGEQFIEKVFHAAAAEMARIGHQDISIEEVAARAGVNKTSIYRRWVTPERLVIDMFERGSEARRAVSDTGSLRQDLVDHLTRYEVRRQQPVVLAIMRMAAMSAFRGELGELVKKFGERERLDVMQLFERGIARGELPRGSNPALAYELTHALALELALTDRVPGDGEGKSAPRHVATLVEVVLLGLANLAMRDAGADASAGRRR